MGGICCKFYLRGNQRNPSSLEQLRSLVLTCVTAICREESVLEHIQPNEFHVRLQDPSFLEEAQLIDVREPEEVYELVSFTIVEYSLAALISFIYLFI